MKPSPVSSASNLGLASVIAFEGTVLYGMRVPFVLAISEHESSRHGAALTSDMRKWFAGSAFLFRKLETTVNITTSWSYLADTFRRSRLQLEMAFTTK